MPLAEAPDGSVYITPKQMYDELLRLRDAVQGLCKTLDPALDDIRNDVGDHETRIRALERRMWQAVGASAVLSSLGGAFLSRLIGG